MHGKIDSTYSSVFTSVPHSPFFSENLITVYPNPVNDVLNFASDDTRIRFDKVLIFDAYGNMLIEKLYFEQNKISFNVSEFPLGTYLLVALENGNSVTHKKFIKIEY